MQMSGCRWSSVHVNDWISVSGIHANEWMSME